MKPIAGGRRPGLGTVCGLGTGYGLGTGRRLAYGLLALLAAACIRTPLQSAELLTWSAVNQPLSRALSDLGLLSEETPSLAFDVAISPLAIRPITVGLYAAEPAAVRQALAFAGGLWWAQNPAGGTVFTAAAVPPRGPLRARTHPSGLRQAPASEALVRTMIAPWLGSGSAPGEPATLTYGSENGLWLATLDDAGQARLVEILALLQLPTPTVPPLVADPGTPLGGRPVRVALGVMTWADWVTGLSQATALSVSLAPGLATTPAPAISAATIAEVPAALAQAGIRCVCIQGVWCLSRSTIPDERQHPAQRRRLGIIPLPHLADDEAAGQRLAAGLRAEVVPEAWTRPGWCLAWLPNAPGIADIRGLIVAADPPTIHTLLDACDVLDRLGVEAGLEALAR